MDGNIAFTEDIKWIELTQQKFFAHKHAKNVPTQIVGFYRPERASKNNIKDKSNNSFDYPMMEYFFMAAGRGTVFLIDYIKAIN